MSIGFDKFFDRQGNPLTLEEWGALMENKAYQIVRQEKVGSLYVSTVWLGIDHGFGFSEWPVIFETMVFGGASEEQHRYVSEQEAIEGHERVVSDLRLLTRALEGGSSDSSRAAEIRAIDAAAEGLPEGGDGT